MVEYLLGASPGMRDKGQRAEQGEVVERGSTGLEHQVGSAPPPPCRDRGWELEDDPGHDLDHHPSLRHPGHLCGG